MSKAEREVATATVSQGRVICPKCGSSDSTLPHTTGNGIAYNCSRCWLVFTPPSLPEAVAGNASAPVGEVQPRLLKVVEWLHMKMAAAQNLPYEDGDLCLECVDAVRDELMPLMERTLAGQRERIAIVLWELRSPAALRNWDTAAPWIKDYHYGQADAVLATLSAPAPVGVQHTTFLSIFASKISALYGIADDLAEQCEALEKEQRNA